VEQVFTTVKEVLREMDVDTAAGEALVLAAWPEIAGEMLRERTRAVGYVERTLVVEVQDLTWKRNLECLAPQMLAKLNRGLAGTPVDLIDFRVAKPSSGKKRGASGSTALSNVPTTLSRAAEKISDAALRESFIAAAAVYLEQK